MTIQEYFKMNVLNTVKRLLKSILLVIKAGAKIETRKDRFTRYALLNKWKNEETVSGGGSTIEFTANLRKELPKLLRDFGIQVFFDAPCGDFNWLRTVDLSGIIYIGGDIVHDLISRNNELYSSETKIFREIDIVKEKLPSADLWLCRDCLFHFSEAEIFETLANFLKSDIRYILTTCSPNCHQNKDIRTGSYRELNLLIKPFNFPEPILWIDDWVAPHPVQKLGLWEKSTLKSILESKREIREFL